MGLVKITFDGSSVSSKQDADINYHVTGLVAAGIIRGLGKELQCSVSNNYITFKDGYVQIYGRRIYVEEGSSVYISLDSTKNGYVVITVDLVNNTAILDKVESSSGFPTLVQENLHNGGRTYQMPLAKYSKNTTSIQLVNFERTYIETPLSVAEAGYENAVTYIEDRMKPYNWKGNWSSNTTTCYLTSLQYATYPDTMFVLHISCGVTVCVPGRFISALSNFTVEYVYGGTAYIISTTCDKTNEYIQFKTSNTSHYIKTIYGVR